ncbi:MAG: hypothetical protein A4S09_06540 [Proteobacteria bacterium SG_bin7]|nr:MAG: hypothetical protein A4S09_06540 [Proteobacteria bacterium SG_bin7]
MSLRSEPTSQSLEKKLLIMGFEVPDILAIFLSLAILNFIFGSTNYKLLLVWGPVVLVACGLRIGKRGKPDNYLVHLCKFHMRPKYLSAFKDPSVSISPPKIKKVSL